MKNDPDLLVIGGGSGGLATAIRAARHGAKVTLFEPHDGLAIRSETEVAGFNDAGVHRPDRDLVQVLAFDGDFSAAGFVELRFDLQCLAAQYINALMKRCAITVRD